MKADGSNYTGATAPAHRPMAALKDLVNSDYAKKRFHEVMGEKAPAFLASVLNAAKTNPRLLECEPQSVISAAMVAATLDLPIDPSLGFSAIVPYKNKGRMVAQFQIMTKGFVQLALRSGQYKTINVAPIYEDEFESVDIITGEVLIHPVDNGYRDQDNADKIVGYVAYFRLLNGFERKDFWSMKKILAHGKRFSKTYEYDSGLWKTDLHAMASKTVLKNTLSKWGILSTAMQTGIKTDQASIKDYDGKTLDDANVEYVDSTTGDAEEGLPANAQNQPLGASERKVDAEHAEAPETDSQAQPSQAASEPMPASRSAQAAKAGKPAAPGPASQPPRATAGPDGGLFEGPDPTKRPDEDDIF